MKKFTIIAFICITLTGSAQESADTLELIAQESCNCISELTLAEDTSQRNMQLGVCIYKAASPYRELLKSRYKVDLNNLNAKEGTKLGELIGARMLSSCPDIFLTISKGESVNTSEKETESVTRIQGVRTGTLNEIREDQFISLLITTAGRQYQYLWLEPFQNDFDLAQHPNKYLNQEISIQYTEKEMFDPRIQDYRSFLIITAISLIHANPGR